MEFQGSHPYLESAREIIERFTATNPEWLSLMAEIKRSGLDFSMAMEAELIVSSSADENFADDATGNKNIEGAPTQHPAAILKIHQKLEALINGARNGALRKRISRANNNGFDISLALEYLRQDGRASIPLGRKMDRNRKSRKQKFGAISQKDSKFLSGLGIKPE